ncbi:GMC oxidoreductase [Rhizoctonia solani]|uniref:GMC oxidoreductase n=1 Tax=Rhizoctonia solani TaxID=456999 RepID=A0A8H8NW18_9AGAM|nr:GMC oxidoreductase [Rhizoctonia solani]QRW20974.1 GMC oxidoreductase [Rhizoctonia solani]
MSQVYADFDIVFVGGTTACVTAGRLAKANPELHILLVEQGPNNYQEPNVVTPALFLSHQAPGSKTTIFWKGNKSDALNGRSPIVSTGRILGGGSRWKLTTSLLVVKLMDMRVSYSDKENFPAVAQAYLEVAQKRGVPLVQDKQDLNTGHGCQRWAKWIDPATGVRQDAAHRYPSSMQQQTLAHYDCDQGCPCHFEGTKATGIEVVADKDTEEDANQTPYIINARKLRSGVGEAERLKKLGIQVVSDLPVGSTYEDHNLVLTPYHVADDTETIDPIMYQDPAFLEEAQAQFAQGKGALATNWIDAGSKLRPTPKELEEIGPAFAPVWKSYFESKPDKALVEGWLGPRNILPYKKARMILMGNYTGYPISRGHVYITSTDPYADPDFETGFLDKQADVDVQIWAYKQARCVKLDGPPDVNNVKDIVYTPEDNKAIEAYLRQFVETTWHSVGTVLMKPREQGGCVDARLNVYGTQNLKVADLSIIPGNVGANTNSTALVTGEKAAVIIAEDLGLNLD